MLLVFRGGGDTVGRGMFGGEMVVMEGFWKMLGQKGGDAASFTSLLHKGRIELGPPPGLWLWDKVDSSKNTGQRSHINRTLI